MIHFENIWDQVESSTVSTSLNEAVEELKNQVNDLQIPAQQQIGRILLLLAIVSRETSINVWQALVEAEEEYLIEKDVE